MPEENHLKCCPQTSILHTPYFFSFFPVPSSLFLSRTNASHKHNQSESEGRAITKLFTAKGQVCSVNHGKCQWALAARNHGALVKKHCWPLSRSLSRQAGLWISHSLLVVVSLTWIPVTQDYWQHKLVHWNTLQRNPMVLTLHRETPGTCCIQTLSRETPMSSEPFWQGTIPIHHWPWKTTQAICRQVGRYFPVIVILGRSS